MQYLNIELAVNSDEKGYKEELATYEKYFDRIANKKDVEKQGFFWAVKEAKIIEGSAVVMGSNQMTPTLNVSEKIEPSDDTQTEPLLNSTQKIALINNHFKK